MGKETRPTSRINYSSEVEQEITDLIRQHWGVSRTYTYLSTLCQAETRLRGFCHYFRLCAKRCLRNADRLMRFQIVEQEITDLIRQHWGVSRTTPIVHSVSSGNQIAWFLSLLPPMCPNAAYVTRID
ncbi:hypothetical protein FGIG_06499 [Fasciola gigantica]|uniref:Uncharacterized protein n=1 Tax=Fasciola gigantica TaxID=46835 RepID=A0A504Y746_FASGI|nr:hypothetical protein FGIG_06499 [Fasciola gigantica]